MDVVFTCEGLLLCCYEFEKGHKNLLEPLRLLFVCLHHCFINIYMGIIIISDLFPRHILIFSLIKSEELATEPSSMGNQSRVFTG